MLRLLVGSAALGALMLARREGLPARRALPGIAVCGVLWFGVYNVALNDAERRLDAGTAAMLVNVGPVLIALLAAALLREGLPRPLLLGCLVAFAGVAVIGFTGPHHGLRPSLGVGLCLLAACAYAVGVVAQKPALATPRRCRRPGWLHDRGRPLPPVRLLALARACERPAHVDRLGRLSRHRPDGDRIHHLGLRPLAHDGGADGGDDLPGATARNPHELGAARPDAADARPGGRGPLPGRRRRDALALNAHRAAAQAARRPNARSTRW